MREMDEKTFEIRDGEIDVEEIMARIRENIRRRKEAGMYPADPVFPAVPDDRGVHGGTSATARDIASLSDTWNIQNSGYFISSHRPVAGKFLVKGRELVHGEVRRYVDPVFWKQSEFNGSVARVFNDLDVRLADLESRLHPDGAYITTVRDGATRQILGVLNKVRSEIRGEVGGQIQQTEVELRDEISSVQKQTEADVRDIAAGMKSDIKAIMQECLRREDEEIRAEISSLRAEIETAKVNRTIIDEVVQKEVQKALLSMDTEIRNRAWLVGLQDRTDTAKYREQPGGDTPYMGDINYFLFNDEIGPAWSRVGGRPSDTPNVFEDLTALFGDCNNVLDIGCGKGYFLNLLKESGIGCYGIDVNEDFVMYCQKLGLNVEQVDAHTHLGEIDEKSLDGVYIGQLVEHLDADRILDLLKLCYGKMQYGSYIAILTPNIESVIVSANLFYMDPTHKTHVHPEVLKFLLKSCGFREIEERYYQPVPDDKKLKLLVACDSLDKETLDALNHNIGILNNFLFGYRDYLLIGKK